MFFKLKKILKNVLLKIEEALGCCSNPPNRKQCVSSLAHLDTWHKPTSLPRDPPLNTLCPFLSTSEGLCCVYYPHPHPTPPTTTTTAAVITNTPSPSALRPPARHSHSPHALSLRRVCHPHQKKKLSPPLICLEVQTPDCTHPIGPESPLLDARFIYFLLVLYWSWLFLFYLETGNSWSMPFFSGCFFVYFSNGSGLCQTVTGTQSVTLCLLVLAVDIFPNIYQPLPQRLKSPSLRQRGRGWSSTLRPKIIPGYALVWTWLDWRAGCTKRGTKGSETKRDSVQYSRARGADVLLSMSYLLSLSFSLQGYHRSNHFIATQGEYHWRAWRVCLCLSTQWTAAGSDCVVCPYRIMKTPIVHASLS